MSETSGRTRRARPVAAAGLDAAALLVLGTLALLGFRNTFTGWAYLGIGVLGLVAGILVAFGLRAARQPVIVVAAAVLLVFLLLGGPLVLGGSPFAPAVAHRLAVSSVYAWKQLLTTLPPVPAGDPLVVIPFLLGLLGGSAGYLLAQVLPAPRRSTGLRAVLVATAVVIVPIGMLATAIAFGTDVPGAELPDGVAFAVLVLCWIAVRRNRTRPLAVSGSRRMARFATAAGLLAVAALGAAALAPILPGAHPAGRTVLRDEVVPPFDVHAYPSPLVGFRKYTKAANQLYDQTLFTVKGLPAGATIRIASLDDYDGLVWGATNGTGGDEFQRVGTAIAAPGEPTTRVAVKIASAYAGQTDLSAWLPVAGTVADVHLDGAAGDSTLHFNRAGQDGVVTGRLRSGDTYSFDTVLGNPSLPADTQPYGEPALTDNAESLLEPHIATWTSGAAGLNAQLKAVATALRNTGAYSDGGLNEGQYLPGHSLGRLTSFVNGPQPVGDDEQYAAAYALVANDLGIPARVVFGARPEADGTVRGQDIHAWVEVHVSDGSTDGTWVPIPESQFMPDPTKKPDQQPPQQTQNVNAAIVPPPNAVHRPPSAVDQQSNETVIPPRRPGPPSLLGRIWNAIKPYLPWVGPPILAALLVAGVILGWKVRRRRRRCNHGSAANRYAGGWRELVDLARDAGLDVPAGRTRQQQAEMLIGGGPTAAGRRAGAGPGRHRGSAPIPKRRRRPAPPPVEFAATVKGIGHAFPAYAPTTQAQIRALADAADLAVYGPDEPTPADAASYWAGVSTARRMMLSRYSRRRRLLIRLSPRSMRPLPNRPRITAGDPA